MENRKTGRNAVSPIFLGETPKQKHFHTSNLPTDMDIKNANLILKLA